MAAFVLAREGKEGPSSLPGTAVAIVRSNDPAYDKLFLCVTGGAASGVGAGVEPGSFKVRLDAKGKQVARLMPGLKKGAEVHVDVAEEMRKVPHAMIAAEEALRSSAAPAAALPPPLAAERKRRREEGEAAAEELRAAYNVPAGAGAGKGGGASAARIDAKAAFARRLEAQREAARLLMEGTALERAALAARSLRALLADPNDTTQVFLQL